MKRQYTKSRQEVKKYLVSFSSSWDEFDIAFERALEDVANGRTVRWHSTPSVYAEYCFANICRRYGLKYFD